jgi:hypothetical protein
MSSYSVSTYFSAPLRASADFRLWSLAYAELYLTLATLFRQFDMELYETDRSCVDPKYDYFAPFPENDDMDSGRVRVLVK